MAGSIEDVLAEIEAGFEHGPFRISRDQALALARITEWPRLLALGALATSVKTRYASSSEGVVRCSAEYMGSFCSEECTFCLFGADTPTEIILDRPPFAKNAVEIVRRAKERESGGATRFKIVTTGRNLPDGEFDEVCEAYRILRRTTQLHLCASLGFLTKERILQLKSAGVAAINNNIETSRGFFPNVCKTHTFDEKVATICTAKESGLEVCSGIVVGMGETDEDRIDAALTLRELSVDSAPFNIFVPTRGQHLALPATPPFELLRSLAIFRLVLPTIPIMCNAGRQRLGALHPFIYAMGASGYALKSYLTPQWDPAIDREIVASLDLSQRNGCPGNSSACEPSRAGRVVCARTTGSANQRNQAEGTSSQDPHRSESEGSGRSDNAKEGL